MDVMLSVLTSKYMLESGLKEEEKAIIGDF